jgi:molybdopterin converting factor small subunit
MPRTAVRVRYYAQLREALKTDAEEVEVETPVDERGLLERLAGLHPRQRELFLASRIAVGDAYAQPGRSWQGAELDSGVDIISPISGG